MKRRKFIQNFALTGSGVALFPVLMNSSIPLHDKIFFRIIASEVEHQEVKIPDNKRIPLNRKSFPVSANSAVTKLQFPKFEQTYKHIWLRLTAAIDFREELTIVASLTGSGQEIGEFDIRYAHPFQPFEIRVNPDLLREIGEQGISLRMTKGKIDAWFFQSDSRDTDYEGLQPHLLITESLKSPNSFRQNLLSMNSFSPFGWLGGCVLDGLWEMAQKGDQEAMQTLKKHLKCFLDSEKGIIFESPMTEPRDGTFNSIEDFLPFAAIIGLYPEHPSVQMAFDFLKSKERPDGMIISGNDITTEGCYTIAYPLAVLAVKRYNRELAQTALNQLLFRIKYLSCQTTIFQRSTLDGHQTFANWGRGVAWYLLGMAKTLNVIQNSPFNDLKEIEEIKAEFKRVVSMVCRWQNKEGLWYSFIDRSETGIDTSASAGIATALVWGIRLKLLDESMLKKARKSHKAIMDYLTPDGFLTHVCQINRGGENLQAGGYRVISQFGMGLLAQLESIL